MNFDSVLSNHLIDVLGWTLVHSVWQLALIAAFLFIALRLLSHSSASLRYLLSVAALTLSVVSPVISFLQISRQIGFTDSNLTRQVANTHLQNVSNGSMERVPTIDGMRADSLRGDRINETISASGIFAIAKDEVPSSFPIVITIWLVGIGLCTLRLAGGLWKLHGFKQNGTTRAEAEWHKRLAVLCDELGIGRTVELIRSDLITTPIAVGLIKPMIIVPTSLFLQIPPQQLEVIILHELIHIRRFDCLVNAFQCVAEILFFYHPAVWWMSAEIRREREFAADAAVLKVAGDRVIYATALADLEELRLTANMTVPSTAVAANGGNLMERIKRILNKKTEISGASSAWSAGIAISTISILSLMLFSFSPSSVVNGQKRNDSERKVAIGFVSIPPLDRSADPPKDADATARLLIAKLQQYKVPAIGFVTGSQVSNGEKLFPVRAEIVRMWRDAGFEIGVGGFKHLPFHDKPLSEYIANVEKDETVVKQILGERNMSPRYFSYPYLYTRKNDDHQKFEAWLKQQGLTSVKYTIDNNEWIYSFAYDMARNDNDVNTMKEVRTAYLDYMTRMFEHYEAYSKEMFGRDIPETMVLTPSRLVADSADDLFAMITSRGYKFVSMDEALTDDAFSTPENYSGDNGVSWFDRWTLTAGKRLKDEPEIAPFVQKIWDKNHSSDK